MEVLIGSENPVKIEATKEVFSKYFGQVKVTGFEVSSKVSGQPINEEPFEGAKNRTLELKKLNEKKNLGGLISLLGSKEESQNFIQSGLP